ncbi:hypothetical protein TNCV_1046651 [Trichonephila clavipes]|nr:hypothetical protein TNCV_1046651 [Trichonephila clavipes]
MANNQSVRRHLDAFTRGRIIGKLEDSRSVINVATEFELLTASFHDFGDNFKLQEQLSGGLVVVVPEEPHPQMTGTLSYRPEETVGRQREKSLDTRHRRLDDRYRILPWPEYCTVVVCLHDALYDESRFSLSSDSHRILIWREREAAIIPRTSLKGTGRRLAARTLPPVTIRELRLAQQDEWAAMPQQLIDTLILSMGRRCETCLAVRGDHIPY